MAIVNGYATLVEIKDVLETTESVHDTLLEIAVESASRAIDKATNRRFWQDGSVVVRYYTPDYSCGFVHTDDISTSTGLIVAIDSAGDRTYATTLTITTDFDLEPINAAADGRPWQRIYYDAWPVTAHSVKVTAKFGWAAVPTEVKQATLIQASRLFSRKSSPYGIAGSPQEGSEMRLLAKLDPDVHALVHPFRRLVVA